MLRRLLATITTAALTTTSLVVLAPAALAATADFTFTPVKPATDQRVDFTAACSDGAATPTWSWSFGDGTAESGKNVNHAYAAAGTYDVTLTPTACPGATAVTKQVTVNDAPTAAFTVTPTTVQGTGQSFEFDASGSSDPNSGDTLTYAWSFGDATTATGQSVEHAYASRGTYTVTLTVTDDKGASDTETAQVRVNDAPSPTFTTMPADPVSGQDITFDASASTDPNGDTLTYTWDFDSRNGTTSAEATGKVVTHAYPVPGTYEVTLTARDGLANDPATRTATSTMSVTVANAAPTADLTASKTEVVTLEEVSFDASGSTDVEPGQQLFTYEFDFGDGTTRASSNEATATHAFTAPGTYTVIVTVTDTENTGGEPKSDTAEIVITVNNAPPTVVFDSQNALGFPGEAFTLDASKSSDPEGGPLTFTWTTVDGDPASGTGPTHTVTYAREGDYPARLVVEDDDGNQVVIDFTVIIDFDRVFRISGTNRQETATALSRTAFTTADTAILARADAFPDALAASSLAAQVDGPILLTSRGAVDAAVRTELERLGVTKVYLAGGQAALSEQVEADLADMNIESERLSGRDRFETAGAIAAEVLSLGGPVKQIIIALGDHSQPGRDAWPDALVAGNLAAYGRAPILLVRPDDVPQATFDALGRSLGRGGRVWIAGGEGAVAARVQRAIENSGYDVRRLAGPNRYATAVAVVEETRRQGADIEPTVLASGVNFPDALAAGVVAWKLGGVMLLVHNENLDLADPTPHWLSVYRDRVDTLYVAGGSKAVSDQVRSQVRTQVQNSIAR